MTTKTKKRKTPELEDAPEVDRFKVFLRAPREGAPREWMTSNGVCLVPPGMAKEDLRNREVYVEGSGHHRYAWKLVGAVEGDLIVKPYLPED